MQIPWDWAFYFLGWCGVCRYGWPSCSHYMVFWFWARGPTHLVEKLKFLLLTGPMALLSQLTFLRISLIYLSDYCGPGQPSSDPLPIPSLPALFLATFLSLSLFMPISYPFSIISIYPHANLTVISIPLSHPHVYTHFHAHACHHFFLNPFNPFHYPFHADIFLSLS